MSLSALRLTIGCDDPPRSEATGRRLAMLSWTKRSEETGDSEREGGSGEGHITGSGRGSRRPKGCRIAADHARECRWCLPMTPLPATCVRPV
jgi:hypothetical protein